MPIAEECMEDWTTSEGETIRVFRQDCAYEDLVAQGKVLNESQINDVRDLAFKLQDDEWGGAHFLARVPKEARGPAGWFAVTDEKMKRQVLKFVRQLQNWDTEE